MVDIPLSRSIFSVAGPQSRQLIQSLITNSIHQLSSSHLLYTGYLSPKGRVLFEGFIYDAQDIVNDKNTFLLDCHTSLSDAFESHLRKYILRKDQVQLASLSSQYQIMASLSHGSYRDCRHAALGYRRIVAKTNASLDTSDSNRLENLYHLRRTLLGVPESPFECHSGESLPFETRLDLMHAIDFHKGCYLGQELTIRTKHTGVIRKRIVPVELSTALDTFGQPDTTRQLLDMTKDPEATRSLLATSLFPVYQPVQGQVYLQPSTTDTQSPAEAAARGKLLSVVGNYGLALLRLEDLESPLHVVLSASGPGHTASGTFHLRPLPQTASTGTDSNPTLERT